MTPKQSKGKGLASSSHGSKRARRTSEEEHEDVRIAPQPLRRYGLYWVMEQEDRLHTLGLGFVFDAAGDCILNMVRELLASWEPKERTNQVKIRGKIINFSPIALNRLLGTPKVDPQPFVNIVKKLTSRDTRQTLCDPNSVAGSTDHQQFGFHVSFPYAHMSMQTRVWLKIGIDVTKTKEPEGVNCPLLYVSERNARIGNMLPHLYGMQILQLRMNGVTQEKLQQLNMDYPLSEHSRALCRVGLGFEEPINDDVATEDEMERVDSNVEYSDAEDEDF
ncbi:hypothetical protein HAX54_044935 [Datura stramonium]|uniref:Uncharacterized protein n=1 Tax=Datura stramonium TaxID=4076 RepID=A0ABS8WJ24_DATST|nr:hypothetical protein [Datura stramonium]